MGCASSKEDILQTLTDGDENAYRSRYDEGAQLGKGEFGVVKIVTEKGKSEQYAMKALKKGYTFKDNTVYAPPKAEQIECECECLRILGGESFNLKLASLYESPSTIYIVTELCAGGEMLEYLSSTMRGGLRTEDVSRMSYQLLSAVDLCARNGIIHRDIKPENTMFKTKRAGAELRLIDFGCATRDEEAGGGGGGRDDEEDLVVHKTFAGTPFYVAPEVYGKSYTAKADVWSVGATLYVLVAGYPADCLQPAYNRMNRPGRDVRQLKNMPEDMPDTYFEMLEDLLTHDAKKRKTAGQILEDREFVRFHRDLEEEKSGGKKKQKSSRVSMRRTKSVMLSGTGTRHVAYLGFQKFERAATTILATVPSKAQLRELLKRMDEHDSSADDDEEEGEEVTLEESAKGATSGGTGNKLKAIKMKALKSILRDMKLTEALDMIDNLKDSASYDDHSYSIEKLRYFAQEEEGGNAAASGSTTTTPATTLANGESEEEEEEGGPNKAAPPPRRGLGGADARNQRFSVVLNRAAKPASGRLKKGGMSMRF